MKKYYKEKGFTLIELLLVIAIISLLAVIVISSLTTARNKAEDAEFVSELRNSSAEIENFYATNKKYPSTVDCTIPDSDTNKCLPSTSASDAVYTYNVDDPANPQVFVLSATGGSEDATYIITSTNPNPTLAANDWGIVNVSEEGNDVWVDPGCIGCNKYDDDYSFYSSLGTVSEWTDPERANATNNIRAYTDTLGARQDYVFTQSPNGTTVGAIRVAIEASSINPGGSITVSISKDGNTFITPTTRVLGVTDSLQEFQFTPSWSTAEAQVTTVRITSNSSDNPVRIDQIKTDIYYITTGGGAGGGAEI